MFWAQGFSQAPWLVQRCVASWQHHNPQWKVVLLNATTIKRYIEPADTGSCLSVAHQSDLFRLQLLVRYGGVWADATTLCRCPLDNWIHAYCSSGFFAFQRPARDRVIANWFLASYPGCVLLERLYRDLLGFWQSHSFPILTDRRRQIVALISCVLNRSECTTRFWFNPLIARWLRIYPYFVFHYAFEHLVARDAVCRLIWSRTPSLSAKMPRLIERLGFHASASPALLGIVHRSSSPLFKLSWQYACDNDFQDTLLHHVLAADY